MCNPKVHELIYYGINLTFTEKNMQMIQIIKNKETISEVEYKPRISKNKNRFI